MKKQHIVTAAYLLTSGLASILHVNATAEHSINSTEKSTFPQVGTTLVAAENIPIAESGVIQAPTLQIKNFLTKLFISANGTYTDEYNRMWDLKDYSEFGTFCMGVDIGTLSDAKAEFLSFTYQRATDFSNPDILFNNGTQIFKFEYKLQILNRKRSVTLIPHRKWSSLSEYSTAELKSRADSGNAHAQNALGTCYFDGREGVQIDLEAAFEWYRKAAEQGHAEAQFNLGGCYKYGEGVSKDDAIAFEWYRKAAEQGLGEAQNNLGFCYKNGEGVSQNDVLAFEWYSKAAERGHANAQLNLGVCYIAGAGVLQDDWLAAQWFAKAAEKGLREAQYNLSGCYKLGKGVPQNDVLAAHWLAKAVENGFTH